MALTDVAIRNAKPKDKAYKLYAGDGLLILITPAGGKLWRQKYRFDGKEKVLALGSYPFVSLKEAKERSFYARKEISQGIDPAVKKKAAKEAKVGGGPDSFENIAREWIDSRSTLWAESHTSKIIRRLELDIFPWLGKRTISEITPPEVLMVLRRIENRGAGDTAHRALQNCGQIFRYAVATGRAPRDCTADLRGALCPVRDGHFAAITDPKKVGAVLQAIEAYQGSITTKCAMRIAPLVFVRPGELRKAEWSEIDFDEKQWNIPPERMKMREPHIVPLSRQVLAILNELRPLTGEGKYLFPSALTDTRPMSDNTILTAFRRMGISKDEMTTHGFRAMARTILDEVLHVRPDYIEHQLAHAVRDPNGRAYNRTAHLDERKKMMQKWADYLDSLKKAPKLTHGQLKKTG